MKTWPAIVLIAFALAACAQAAAPSPEPTAEPANTTAAPAVGPTTCVVLQQTTAYSLEDEYTTVGTVRPGETFHWIREARGGIVAGGSAMTAPVQVVQWRGVSPAEVYIYARMVDCGE